MNQQTEDGFGITDVYINPYQIVVYTVMPKAEVEVSGGIAVFNQNGEVLLSKGYDYEKAIFAVKGMEISKLYIYLFDETADLKVNDIETAKSCAVLEQEINISTEN